MKKLLNKKTIALPKTFVFELTRACNHRCSHCYTVWDAAHPFKQHDHTKHAAELTLKQYKTIIRTLKTTVPTLQTIALSGGEPLLKTWLPELIDCINSHTLTPVLITNGVLLTEDLIDSFIQKDVYFEIPLLSYKPQTHDAMTGIPGSWERVVAVLASMAQKKAHWISVFVASKKNCADLEKTAQLAIALRAQGLMYNRINIAKTNSADAEKLVPTVSMLKKNLNTLQHLKKEYSFASSISVVIEPCVINTQEYPDLHFGFCPMAGEDSYFTIDPSGNIRICNHSPTIVGNILKDDFVDIYYNHAYVHKFRTTLPTECTDCPDELKSFCKGGCKAASEQCYDSLSPVDPFVTLRRKKEKKLIAVET